MSLVIKQILVGKINAEDTSTTGGTKWPLTGGVPSQLNDAENYHVERVYVAGYQDGSVRIWDVTYPALSLICVLGSEVFMLSQTLVVLIDIYLLILLVIIQRCTWE